MKRFIIILLAFAFISSSGYAQERVENTTKPDTIVSVNDTSFSKGNIFTINPLQMIFYGEYLIGWERQVTDKNSYLLGLGVIYRTRQTNRSLIIMPLMLSDYYKGIHIYVGVKKYLQGGFSWSNILYLKYERDYNFDIVDGDVNDRYYGMFSGNYHFFNIEVNRDKFVFGYKLLLGLENKKIGRFFYNTYVGAGVHIKYLDYDPYDFHGEIIHTQKLYPELSIHLGFTIGYRTR